MRSSGSGRRSKMLGFPRSPSIRSRPPRAFTFARHALKVERMVVADVRARSAEVAAEAGLGATVVPERLPEALAVAWRAGQTARDVFVAASLAAQVAYFRASAPDDEALGG